MIKTTLILLLVIFPLSLFSQELAANNQDTLRKDALNVYLDASEFIKKEIPYVNYVRDRKVADLVIIKTYQRTGSGGDEFTYFFEGERMFSGQDDTIKVNTPPDATEDFTRDVQVKALKQGLMRYVMKTPLAKFIDIKFNQPIKDEVTNDPWNNWVFRASLNGFMFGQSTYSNLNAFGGFSASKVTNDWKIDFGIDYSYGKDKFDLGDEIIESITTSKSSNILIVKSINDHWSVGGRSSVNSSSYNNYDLSFNIAPGIEYDLFPYSESTRRQLRLLYTIGYTYNNYTDTTIFNKLDEALMSHRLSAAFEVVQKWGSMSINVNWLNHLRDWSENNLSVNGNISWRVAKGLSINVGGNYSFIHNQIALVKGGASTEEILLRRKELETSFNYFFNFGFSYTFGSIYNNVVNPRFGGGGGERMIIIG